MPWTLKVEDQFNDTGNLDLVSHTPDLGGSWSKVTGGSFGGLLTIDVFGTDVRSDLTVGTAIYKNGQSLGNDQACEIESNDEADNLFYGVMARVAGTTNTDLDGYVFARYHVTDQLQLKRYDNGSATQLGSNVADTFAAGTLIRLECEGTAIRGLRNGSEVIEETDATYGSGVCGLTAEVSSARFGTFMKAYELSGVSPDAGVLAFSGRVPPMNYTIQMPDEL